MPAPEHKLGTRESAPLDARKKSTLA